MSQPVLTLVATREIPLSPMTRSSRAVSSVLNWMRADIQAGTTIDPLKVACWAEALEKAMSSLEARERVVEAGEAQIASMHDVMRDRVDAQYAQDLNDLMKPTLMFLVEHAKQAAKVAEVREIDIAACAILDGFEALSTGVVRKPDTTPYIPPYDGA